MGDRLSAKSNDLRKTRYEMEWECEISRPRTERSELSRYHFDDKNCPRRIH